VATGGTLSTERALDRAYELHATQPPLGVYFQDRPNKPDLLAGA
jgi:hypothetical protein